ncbi:MAG: hypothetical protein ACRED1_09150 [Limisphaerales bacterium]
MKIERMELFGYDGAMTEERPQYKWPRYVLAGVILFLVSSIVWMVVKVRKMEHERDFSAPIEAR